MTAIVVLFALAILLCVGVYLYVAFRSVLAADDTFRQVTTLFDSPHDYAVVNPADFSTVPHEGYDRARSEFLTAGFHYLAALENLRLSQVYPDNRTYIDAYTGPAGTVYAGSYVVRDEETSRQVLECITFFTDGTFLVTNNLRVSQGWDTPYGIDFKRLPEIQSAGDLLVAHRRRLDSVCAATSKEPVPVRTLDNVIEASRKYSELECKYRRERGYLSWEEVQRSSKSVPKGRQFLPGSLRFFYWLFTRRVLKHMAQVSERKEPV